jgi:hypothetical protein
MKDRNTAPAGVMQVNTAVSSSVGGEFVKGIPTHRTVEQATDAVRGQSETVRVSNATGGVAVRLIPSAHLQRDSDTAA